MMVYSIALFDDPADAFARPAIRFKATGFSFRSQYLLQLRQLLLPQGRGVSRSRSFGMHILFALFPAAFEHLADPCLTAIQQMGYLLATDAFFTQPDDLCEPERLR